LGRKAALRESAGFAGRRRIAEVTRRVDRNPQGKATSASWG